MGKILIKYMGADLDLDYRLDVYPENNVAAFTVTTLNFDIPIPKTFLIFCYPVGNDGSVNWQETKMFHFRTFEKGHEYEEVEENIKQLVTDRLRAEMLAADHA
jgi:hypothetical protein